MLNYGLSASEGTGNGRHAPLCDGEKRIDNALSRNHRHGRRHLFFIRSASSNRPFLQHGEFLIAFLRCEHGNRLGDVEFPALYLFHRTFQTVRNHDLMVYDTRFLYRTEHVARLHEIPGLDGRLKLPQFFVVEIIEGNSTGNTVAVFFAYAFERTLNSVEYPLDQTGCEFNGKRRSRAFHDFARP